MSKTKAIIVATCMHGVTVVDVNLILGLFLATHSYLFSWLVGSS